MWLIIALQDRNTCEERDVAVARHHSYGRTLITKYGEIRLDAPVFRCGDCGAMRDEMDVIGKGQTRNRYSKKYPVGRCGLRIWE